MLFFYTMYNEDLVKKVKALYKRDINLIEVSLINYEGLNYYIRIDKDKKNNYYLRSLNMNIVNKFNKKLINQEILHEQPVNIIANIISESKIINQNTCEPNSKADIVHFKANINKVIYNYQFNSFIPKNISFLADVLYMIFFNLPKRMDQIFEELVAVLENKQVKYLYKKPFKFNIFKGDINKIFDKSVIEKGEKYFTNQNVRFLELINETYYATVEGHDSRLYTVMVTYNKKDNATIMSCNCPCEYRCKHMYAVLKSIREDIELKYYKVRYVDNLDTSMYDKLFSLNYYLSLGIDGNRIVLVMPSGELKAFNILDENGKSLFEVVEDDEENNMTNLIKDLEK